ncbi:Enoyl-CoA hydratase [Frankia canadensis]|uniref:Enoyl-CoA hydratase n=1 Tax=Frankia canadensis TaxID=1836972 RepID=A0A2I2KNR7_9ACTN|nr:enoyl-CoA hydratase/isomerase family protein [Frankia canadensis]SNQ47300.1 Enoyl-CoA hydratase [Frankia canadensis]SOU54590.1 Enoyl-CoA hydratase [Frankia canadensis]
MVLKVEKSDDGVAVVTLNRPEHMNAFDAALHDEFPRLMGSLDDDPTLRAIVLTGAGRAFSAGGNTDDFARFATDFQARRRAMRDARRVVDAMLGISIPVVAAVNGPAVGLGCTLATFCDVVFIAENTFLADPHVSVGLVAGDGGAATWPLLTSLLRAKEYILTGERLPAAKAVEFGLANHAVPADELLDRAIAFARKIAAQPPQAVQDTKNVLNQHLRAAATATLGMGLAAESQSHDTAEYAAIAESMLRKANGRAAKA